MPLKVEFVHEFLHFALHWFIMVNNQTDGIKSTYFIFKNLIMLYVCMYRFISAYST